MAALMLMRFKMRWRTATFLARADLWGWPSARGGGLIMRKIAKQIPIQIPIQIPYYDILRMEGRYLVPFHLVDLRLLEDSKKNKQILDGASLRDWESRPAACPIFHRVLSCELNSKGFAAQA